MDKELDFTGKTILVTGSGRNIGRAIVLEFAARGANVIINSRSNREEAESVEKEAQALGAKTLVVMGVAGELSTVEEMKRRAEDTRKAEAAEDFATAAEEIRGRLAVNADGSGTDAGSQGAPSRSNGRR